MIYFFLSLFFSYFLMIGDRWSMAKFVLNFDKPIAFIMLEMVVQKISRVNSSSRRHDLTEGLYLLKRSWPLPLKMCVVGMMLNFITWRGSNFEVLGRVVYYLIVITPRSTFTRSGSTYLHLKILKTIKSRQSFFGKYLLELDVISI